MPTVQIETKGCRACSLCVDICPTKVFDLEPASQVAQANRASDCIGCCSCEYICPSRCVGVSDIPRQLPFYRLDLARDLVSRFLQQPTAQDQIAEADVARAMQDVKTRLRALGESAIETMGRGLRVVGRTAGTVAAAHLPDMYEETTVQALLDRLNLRFAGAFPFSFDIQPSGGMKFSFKNCAMKEVVQEGGGQVGTAALCSLFHEYWAGLLSEFCKGKYVVTQDRADDPCSIMIEAK